MTWNYRIMRYRDEHPEFGHSFGIHEVYYGDDGSVENWTEDAITLVGPDLDDLEWQLRAMLEAFQKPVLEFEPDQPSDGAGEPHQG
jgi:hypothetical protein